MVLILYSSNRFRSVQRPGGSRATGAAARCSRVSLRTRQRASVVASSSSEGKDSTKVETKKDSVAEIKSEIERLEKEREENRKRYGQSGTAKVESKNVKGLTLSARSKSESDSSETKREKKDLLSGLKFFSSSRGKQEKKAGIPKDNIDAFTEWRAAFKKLKDFGLKSVSAKDASNLVKTNKAIILDVRTGAFYDKENPKGSVNVPYFTKVKGSGGKTGKRLFLGPNTTEKNRKFVKGVEDSLGLGFGKTIIVCCSTGGTLKNTVTKRDGSSLVDSQRAFGLESLSLRAASDLIEAGFKNVMHLEGGFPAWISEGLPTEGSSVKAPLKEKVVDPNAWPNVHASLVAAGIDSLDAADASKLVDSGKAVIVDVGAVKRYEDEHVKGSINVPFLRKIETKGLKVAGGVSSLGSSDDALERNPDFLETFKKSVGDKKVIITCMGGGTLRTEVVSKRGKVFKDPQLKNGRDSVSLRAISELLGAGYKKISHLDGGNSKWKMDKRPMSGGFLNKIQGEDAVGWRVAVYFDDQDKYCKGQITSYNVESGMYMVKYDYLGEDGQEVEVSFANNRTKWLNKMSSAGNLKPLEDGRYPSGRKKVSTWRRRRQERQRERDEKRERERKEANMAAKAKERESIRLASPSTREK